MKTGRDAILPGSYISECCLQELISLKANVATSPSLQCPDDLGTGRIQHRRRR